MLCSVGMSSVMITRTSVADMFSQNTSTIMTNQSTSSNTAIPTTPMVNDDSDGMLNWIVYV